MNDIDNAITPRKSLGQHWLTDAESLKAMLEAAEVTSSDTVLEIGPGLGSLTKFLTEQAKEVIAVEFDETLADALPGQLDAINLTVVQQDILKFDLTTLPPDYKVVANIPYYLTSHLIRLLSETPNPPSVAVLLVQKEVAERVAASPGDMSILSVTSQYYWQVSTGQVVHAKLFTPPPKVDSQILIMNRRKSPLFTGVDSKAFFRIVKAGFSSRRKTLLNSLAGGLQQSKETVSEYLAKTCINPTSRPQELSLEDWYKIYNQFKAMV